ncbi:hypothetical protein [Leucobacter luti]|uniref:IrrE N-terminal-like domain-containing protein n=1 Tax=Leucobacter luti TaxID=340320 RepID=A0A4R6S1N7_9MICO|nr:hypothetical protein [Leucobacter luti]MCW2289121.1 hypothetical protein [Leucobacter luti]QYM75037.1 hypothetical protein K1X41_10150 [Leucobacter luti]TCK35482.1 hypothetical protein EDF60_2857 [Leucobacter luti]TDP93441.1 hypothetical protein EDF62_1420 [Leucobacter luti]
MFVPEYDPAYDPLEHLDQMKIHHVRHTLNGHNAIWVPERRMVISDRNLRSELLRPTLAHECDHAVNDDCAGHHPRNESRANLHSAFRLIYPPLWDSMTALHSDYDQICLEIGITRRQFRAYYDHHRRLAAARERRERLGDTVYENPKMGAGQWTRKFEVA